MQINILEYFENTLKHSYERTAVIEGENNISFGELEIKAKKLAEYIIELNEEIINKPIAVYLPKSIDCVVSDIAITYSSNIYMNLDIKTPISRIENILELVKPAYVITNNQFADKLETINVKIINLDILNFKQNKSSYDFSRRFDKLIDTDPMCIINTSGSTGTPKGVVLNHKSFIDFTEWAVDTLDISDNEVLGSLSPSVFDIYSFELCMLMAKGSTIVLIPDTFAAFPAKMLNLMNENNITFIFWVPTVMVNIANMDLLTKIQLMTLKTVWFAGEVFPTKQFNYWKKHLIDTKFINLYGPIEITLDCIYFIVEREIKDEEPIPIGYPCRNTDILLLTDKDTLAQDGEEGEICVRGTSLAMGYYNNPEKTAQAFVQNPLNKSYPEIIYRTGDLAFINENGEMIFKGRKDTLIKHMGYRIELAEIEHIVVNNLKIVENCCVIYNDVKKQIIMIYESKNELETSQLRKVIGEAMPKYMIPTAYIRLDEMPRSTNGKIDRLKLKNDYLIK
jgi:amino acid adenylation domain-containing protein